MKRIHPESRLLPLTVLLAALGSCDGKGADSAEAPEALAHPDLVLRTAGVELRRDEFDRWEEFMRDYFPNAGRKRLARRIFDDLLLERLARHDHPEQHRAAEKEAAALAAVAGNSREFADRTRLMSEDKVYSIRISRFDVTLPVEQWLFDPTRLLQVSEPISDARGWLVTVATETFPQVSPLEDIIEASFAWFPIHGDRAEHDRWAFEARRRLHEEVEWVHPDYRSLVEAWQR